MKRKSFIQLMRRCSAIALASTVVMTSMPATTSVLLADEIKSKASSELEAATGESVVSDAKAIEDTKAAEDAKMATDAKSATDKSTDTDESAATDTKEPETTEVTSEPDNIAQGTNIAMLDIASTEGSTDLIHDGGGLAALNDGEVASRSQAGFSECKAWHCWGQEGKETYAQYEWSDIVEINSSSIFYFVDGGGIILPEKVVYEYYDIDTKEWKLAKTLKLEDGDYDIDKFNTTSFSETIKTNKLRIVLTPQGFGDPSNNHSVGIYEWQVYGEDTGEAVKTEAENDVQNVDGVTVKKLDEGYQLSNDHFIVETGKYGNLDSIRIKGDLYETNYVMNASNASAQAAAAGHQWMGELMFKVKTEGSNGWSEQNTGRSSSGRKVELDGNKVVVTYENSTEEKGIKDFKLIETYSLEKDGKLRWEITVENTSDNNLTIGDFGVPLAFNEYWSGGDAQIYETRTIFHSFVGKDSSYVYASRPSGLGKYLLMTPDTATGAGFEYQDHWRDSERAADELAWCQDQAGWANGLNVFYIHSDVIKATKRGYLDNTSLKLKAGESKTYAFNFQAVENENSMKSALYDQGIIDAVAVPGMTYSIDMPGKMYLHTNVDKDDISFEYQCPHNNGLHTGANTINNNLDCKRTEAGTYAKYLETKIIDGEQYHIYDIKFEDLGQNNIIVKYAKNGEEKQTVLQFYMMDDIAEALDTHADFMVEKTQLNTPGKTGDKVFDDWMMDEKVVRSKQDPTYWQKNYWGWGDDWGLTHGEYIAEKNVYQPNAVQIEAVDKYLDTAIWNGLMREHQKDYLIHDFLMDAPNTSPTYRGYAYAHIYNTYFSMYKICKKYPDTVKYIEDKDTYLLRAYNILKTLYGDGVGYNWETGIMGELTTPAIISALKDEGYYDEAENVVSIMEKKYQNFKNTKYPYGSEYAYDNTGEEAVYTLAKVNLKNDTENALNMMSKIDAKTRACRGLQPIWYHYSNPTTICGENWWNFQYTASLAGYCMDDYLRLQDNKLSETETAKAERANYAAKLANLTCINSGQIDADKDNIGAVSWTYQSEMGNLGGQGTGEGKLHNGWRQMAGESDLGLFGALQILSADVSVDPVFGLFGYGCDVQEKNGKYEVTPLDGLYTRLNLINDKLYIELNRDQYSKAFVSKNKDAVTLEIKNLEKTDHETDIDFTGLSAGSYQIFVDGKQQGSFQAESGKKSNVVFTLPKAATATIEIRKGQASDNKAPVVNAGMDKNLELSEAVRLVAEASDDGYVNSELSYKWEVVSSPEGGSAKIANPDKRITKVSFSEPGEYEFRFTADDGELKASDTVIYTVAEDSKLPDVIAYYDFENLPENATKVETVSGEKYYARLAQNTTITKTGKSGDAVSLNGKISGGYVELENVLTDRVTQATISLDLYLAADQANHTPILSLGKDWSLQLLSGNELCLKVNGKTLKTGVEFENKKWKNIEVVADGDNYSVYVEGAAYGTLENTGLKLSEISDHERYFIGRGESETGAFLKGSVDDFIMISHALSEEEIFAEYGTGEKAQIVGAKEPTVVTKAGVAPELPKQISTLFSNGIYMKKEVVWDEVSEEKYKTAGTVILTGKIKDTDFEVTAKLIVVAGALQNIAEDATPTAIIDSVEDLGGVAGLNDGATPSSSADTSNGAWHNWLGNQGGEAWIQYTWDEAQLISKTELYFFRDGGGHFNPASYVIEYLDEDGKTWRDVENAVGYGVELNKFNTTEFTPVLTKAIRVTMKPDSLGCGVLEWRVYAYKEGEVSDFAGLKTAIKHAKSLDAKLFKSGMDEVEAALTSAESIAADKKSEQSMIDKATKKLYTAIAGLTPVVDNNLAYTASTATSYVSAWESLASVNDGVVAEDGGAVRYGTWGNESSEEFITYHWGTPVEIDSSDIYFWTDNGGIFAPKQYTYQYLDENGEWQDVKNASGYGCYPDAEKESLNGFNTTTFDKVTTTDFRVVMEKNEKDINGVGVMEWQVYGVAKPEMEDTEEPGEGNETPGEGTETPGEGSETPGGEGSETPREGSETPGEEGSESPGEGSENPGGAGSETPGEGTEKPGEGTEKPGEEGKTPGESTETPDETQKKECTLIDYLKECITTKIIKKGSKTEFNLGSIKKSDIKSVTYVSLNPFCATVDKKGTISAKRKGLAVVTALVKLKNGKTRLYTMNIIVK